MNSAVWEAVAGASTEMYDAVLPNHARYRVKDELYPAMIQESGASVRGKLILDVGDAQLDRLNKFEGIGQGFDLREYTLNPVQVVIDGSEVQALTYLATPELAQRIIRQDWDPLFFEMRVSDYMRTVVAEFRLALERGAYGEESAPASTEK